MHQRCPLRASAPGWQLCAAVLQFVWSEFGRFEVWKAWRLRVAEYTRSDLYASGWPSLFQNGAHYILSVVSLLPLDKMWFRHRIASLKVWGRAELPDAILNRAKRLSRRLFAQLSPLPKQSFRSNR